MTKPNYPLTGRVLSSSVLLTRDPSIWSSFKGIVSTSPIAIVDGRGLDPEKDILRVDTGTLMRHGRYRDGHHWYYMSEQAKQDVPMFKTYDSDKSLPSTTCLRTTFNIPNPLTETLSKTI